MKITAALVLVIPLVACAQDSTHQVSSSTNPSGTNNLSSDPVIPANYSSSDSIAFTSDDLEPIALNTSSVSKIKVTHTCVFTHENVSQFTLGLDALNITCPVACPVDSIALAGHAVGESTTHPLGSVATQFDNKNYNFVERHSETEPNVITLLEIDGPNDQFFRPDYEFNYIPEYRIHAVGFCLTQ